MIGLKRPGALLGLAPALVLVMAGGDPSESPTEEPVDPDYAAGKPAMAVKDWPGAIRSLSSASLRDARNADIQNDLGHAYGQTGHLELAFKHYQRALEVNRSIAAPTNTSSVTSAPWSSRRQGGETAVTSRIGAEG